MAVINNNVTFRYYAILNKIVKLYNIRNLIKLGDFRGNAFIPLFTKCIQTHINYIYAYDTNYNIHVIKTATFLKLLIEMNDSIHSKHSIIDFEPTDPLKNYRDLYLSVAPILLEYANMILGSEIMDENIDSFILELKHAYDLSNPTKKNQKTNENIKGWITTTFKDKIYLIAEAVPRRWV